MYGLKHKLTQLRDVPNFVRDQLSKDGFDLKRNRKVLKSKKTNVKDKDEIRGFEDINPNDDFTKLMTPDKNTAVLKL